MNTNTTSVYTASNTTTTQAINQPSTQLDPNVVRPVQTSQESHNKCLPVFHTHRITGATVVFKPLEAKFNKDKDPIGKMDPYCKFKIGWSHGKSSVAKSGGTNPTWPLTEEIVIERKHAQKYAKVKVKDKDRLTLNDNLGQTKIDLDEIAVKGKVVQWFNLYKGDMLTGQILLDIQYNAPPSH